MKTKKKHKASIAHQKLIERMKNESNRYKKAQLLKDIKASHLLTPAQYKRRRERLRRNNAISKQKIADQIELERLGGDFLPSVESIEFGL